MRTHGCALLVAMMLVFSSPVCAQRAKSGGWRFPTNRMKGTYLSAGKGEVKVLYISYDLGDGYSAGHINWYNDDRVMVVFPRDLDERIADYAQQHPGETNPNFRAILHAAAERRKPE